MIRLEKSWENIIVYRKTRFYAYLSKISEKSSIGNIKKCTTFHHITWIFNVIEFKSDLNARCQKLRKQNNTFFLFFTLDFWNISQYINNKLNHSIKDFILFYLCPLMSWSVYIYQDSHKISISKFSNFSWISPTF